MEIGTVNYFWTQVVLGDTRKASKEDVFSRHFNSGQTNWRNLCQGGRGRGGRNRHKFSEAVQHCFLT